MTYRLDRFEAHIKEMRGYIPTPPGSFDGVDEFESDDNDEVQGGNNQSRDEDPPEASQPFFFPQDEQDPTAGASSSTPLDQEVSWHATQISQPQPPTN